MTPARFQTIEEIYRAALDQKPDQVNAFLDRACEGDEVLRRKVEALLASRERAADFIETSALGLATKIIQNGQAESLVGHTIGHYKISDPIGTGGMGEVYLATDVVAGRKAALKLLPLRFTGDAERLKRFQQEARAVVGLNHPNIVTVYEIGDDHSTHYIASELIKGETLRERLTRGRMELSEAVEVAIQVASALVAAHDASVVHRDIKPENIMLRPDGYVKVLDFGIAKLAEQEVPITTPKDEALLLVETNLGSILGTTRYMSPEQASGAPVDKRTDIWSLGVVLYEMVTGHVPFTGDTPGEVMSAILQSKPPPLTHYVARTPAELQQIIGKTLRKDPDQRYHSAHELLDALKGLRHKLEVETELERSIAAPPWLRWTRSPVALVLVALVSALALALPFYRHRKPAPSLPPDKSIAVLPLENLSDEKDNAFFAAGIHDELLSNLSKIKDLKVISRTSVRQYKSGSPRNLREIGEQLGVAHVLEGSVQRVANRVKVSAQLIDARTDAHLWSQTYDRDLTDVFAIQSDIARTIADQLEAKLSPAEKAAIVEPPTSDPIAYSYYTQAIGIGCNADWEGWDKSSSRAVELLEKATQRDPHFALAYCELATTYGDLYSMTWDPKYIELAKKAADAAVRLRPDLSETHLELARYYFRAGFSPAGGTSGGIHTDSFDRARHELAIARRALPNNLEALFIEARIDRRQNRWDSALTNLQKAHSLDPRNREVAFYLGDTYRYMRRYSETEQVIKKRAAIGTIEGPWAQTLLADIKLVQGDPVGAQFLLEQIPLDFSPTEQIWQIRFHAALYLRDYDAADRVMAATPVKWADQALEGRYPESWADGQIARARGDRQKAQAVFAAARDKWVSTWGDKPKDEAYFARIARFDAALGRKEDAISEALHAVELMPLAKDSIAGPYFVTNLALVYAWMGERDRALEQLETVATIPAGPSYGDLRFNPCWDALRGDKRFDKIVAAAKAASRYALEPLPEKSIAVLPLENLSTEKENAFFAAGVHDELLSNLSKIKDLKVMSRTSVMQYKSSNSRNFREIGQQLGVAHVLEGSVQRAANRVKVSAQLIDARTDAHLWAQTYDRELSDIFSVESEVAMAIADQLRAKLTGQEEQAISAKPTDNVAAYDAYLRGLAFDARSVHALYYPDLAAKAAGFYERAVELDPKFALAWARLSRVNAHLYFHGWLGTTSAQRDAAKRALEKAQKLEPNSPETLLALGYYQYYVLRDYGAAKTTFERVSEMLPGSSEAPAALGRVMRREGNWNQSIAYFERALALDPRNVALLVDVAETYSPVRQFSAALKLYDRVLDISPNDPNAMTVKASIHQAQGNLQGAAKLLSEIDGQTPSDLAFSRKINQLRFERNYGEAVRLLQARLTQFHYDSQDIQKAVDQVELAFIQRVAGDWASAKVTAEQSRDILERLYRDESHMPHGRAHLAAYLSRAYAVMGEKDSALKIAAHAIMLHPRAKDPKIGPAFEENLALIQTMFGENSQAISTLAQLLQTSYNSWHYGPPSITPALLRLDPLWDPIRNDPRFQELVAEKKL